jgi:hypothetical protein
MTKKYFCTFSDSRMWRSLERVKKQAEKASYFDAILINDENDLNESFRNKFKDKLIKGSRGFGYWVWKPQIILQAIEKMNHGDFLLYMDAGCHFNKGGIKRMDDYFEKANKSSTKILGFQESIPSENRELEVGQHLEKMWTKGDVFDFFGERHNPLFYDTGQVTGTVVVVVEEESKRIIRQWLSVFETNWHLVDDSPSVSPNFPEFIEHRHDQSIFSMIAKKERIPTVSASELWQKDWGLLKNYPIWAKRDINLGCLGNCKKYIQRKYKGAKLRASKILKKDVRQDEATIPYYTVYIARFSERIVYAKNVPRQGN